MREIIKDFYQLDNDELFEMYRLRVSVFVVEQNCPYQEVDETDREALHLFLRDEEGIAAYCRLFRLDAATARVGRVIAVRRRQGLGSRVVSLAMEAAKDRLGAKRMVVEAQCYAVPMYEKLGFATVGEEFLDDGIPHIRMEREFGV